MTVTYACLIDQQHGLNYCALYGTFSDQEAYAARKNLSEHPDYKDTYDTLIDLTDGVSFIGGFNEVSNLVSRTVRLITPNAFAQKRAVIAKSDVLFGVARMYQQIAVGRMDVPPTICQSDDAADSYFDLPKGTITHLRAKAKAEMLCTA
jgi:hypothetical protein